MKIKENKTQQAGIEASRKKFGVVEIIQCIQKVDTGSGDYVKDRQAWQKGYSVDSLLKAVEAEQ
ncbi:MAG: hypothetical protein D3924_13035 [Candidatus Electrothrix sp. AR4]|nr:hypothetical protein [Candidatus Electrothrix sp. AR4]